MDAGGYAAARNAGNAGVRWNGDTNGAQPAEAFAAVSVTDLAREAASRYVAMVPLRQMLTDHVAAEVARSETPPDQREAVVHRFTDRLHDLVVRIFIAEAAAHFTVAELHALVRFYSSPEGQSLMRKLAGFTRDLERAINTEIGSVPPASSS